ncbi:MAG: hypothetical protein ABSC21_13655 [Terriglobia bacterium]
MPSRKPGEDFIAVIIALLARDVVALPSYAFSESFSNGVRRFTKRCERSSVFTMKFKPVVPKRGSASGDID